LRAHRRPSWRRRPGNRGSDRRVSPLRHDSLTKPLSQYLHVDDLQVWIGRQAKDVSPQTRQRAVPLDLGSPHQFGLRDPEAKSLECPASRQHLAGSPRRCPRTRQVTPRRVFHGVGPLAQNKANGGRSPVKQRGKDMEGPLSSIGDRRTAIIAFLREALVEGAVSCCELELKAREVGLLGRFQSITHAKLFRRPTRFLAYDRFELVLDRLEGGGGSCPGSRRHPPLPPQYSYRKQGLGPRTPMRQARPASGMPRPPMAGPPPNPVGRLDYHQVPAGIRLHRWPQFVDDCSAFWPQPTTVPRVQPL
jgi:hypothetical protein